MNRTTVINNFSHGIDRSERGSEPIEIPPKQRVLPPETPKYINTLPNFSKTGAWWFDGDLNIWDGSVTRLPTSFRLYVNNFNLNTSTGNQSVTGVGFTPQLTFFLNQRSAASADGSDIYQSIGWAVSSTARAVLYQGEEQAHDISVDPSMRKVHDATHVVLIKDDPESNTTDYSVDFESNDSDGFTVDVDNAPPSGYNTGFMCLEGFDNVATGYYQGPNATGNFSVTGLGFQPTSLILLSNGRTTAPTSTSQDIALSIGFADGTNNACVSLEHLFVAALGNFTLSRGTASYCLTTIKAFNGVVAERASLSSFDADGFTLNYATQDATRRYTHYIALKGAQTLVGNFTLSGSTGNQIVTGAGFQPKGAIFISHIKTNLDTSSADGKFCIGITDGTNHYVNMHWSKPTPFSAPYLTDTYRQSSSSYIFVNNVGAGSIETASFVSFDPDGFTLNIDVASPSPSRVMVMLFG